MVARSFETISGIGTLITLGPCLTCQKYLNAACPPQTTPITPNRSIRSFPKHDGALASGQH